MSKVAVHETGNTAEKSAHLMAAKDSLLHRIQAKAYELFEKEGWEDGHDVEQWLEAERQILCGDRMELIDQQGAYELNVLVPGMKAKELYVDATPEGVVVKGYSIHHHEAGDGEPEFAETREEQFYREVPFPQPIEVDTVIAELERGMLHIEAKKATESDVAKEVSKAAI